MALDQLSQLFKAVAHKSALLVPCEVAPGHSDNRYVRVSFAKSVLTRVASGNDFIQVPVEAKVEINVCPSCFNKFVYDMTKVAQEVNVA